MNLLQGSPETIGLHPKQHALQSQPTVSQSLYYAVKRGYVDIKPNIAQVCARASAPLVGRMEVPAHRHIHPSIAAPFADIALGTTPHARRGWLRPDCRQHGHVRRR